MDRSEPFFMVYGLGQGSPNFIHDSLEQATAEAKRLADRYPGIRFYVLATVGRAEKVSVEFRQIHPDDVPF
jgi:hypothetical protein